MSEISYKLNRMIDSMFNLHGINPTTLNKVVHLVSIGYLQLMPSNLKDKWIPQTEVRDDSRLVVVGWTNIDDLDYPF
ncbi:hypothetical protein SP15_206 [Bacillus phage SP-15]|uniref:Uncharacterized protein n=1 Tax=Bacillus phage SP-15 TaxID=1792032 RepID=A0A127AWC5_9CAUD|nr:hypothetical protein SP15_206 [Bacillus phage SP-15]AMM45006.1 hypothetical protein SP15_206 [Bacillus phage SP-15]